MKLNTLLLTSAATLMATSVAFAADLPSKKAAPSSGSVQVCKVGGMTGFTLPGSDTCVSIGGRVTFDASYDLNADSSDASSATGLGAGYRLSVDARSNTEIGVVRSFIQLEGGSVTGYSDYAGQTGNSVASTRRAYIQFSGLTVGKKDSLADIFGTESNQLGLASQSNVGIDYKMNAGGVSLALGLEQANNNNNKDYDTTSLDSADSPDIVAQVAASTGPLNFKIAAVSHTAYDYEYDKPVQGYALLGHVDAKMNNVGLYAFGGMAKAAGNYIAANSLDNQYDDYYLDAYYVDDSYKALQSSTFGGGINFTIGKTFVNFEALRAQHVDDYNDYKKTVDQFDVYINHPLAKNLSIQPEYMYTRTNDTSLTTEKSDSHAIYVRIQRDF